MDDTIWDGAAIQTKKIFKDSTTKARERQHQETVSAQSLDHAASKCPVSGFRPIDRRPYNGFQVYDYRVTKAL
jgi:hypothetical protein